MSPSTIHIMRLRKSPVAALCARRGGVFIWKTTAVTDCRHRKSDFCRARFHMAVLGNLGPGGARHTVRAVAANEKALVGNRGGQGAARPANQCAVEFNGHGLRPLENFRRSVAASRPNATNLGAGLVWSGSVWFGRLVV